MKPPRHTDPQSVISWWHPRGPEQSGTIHCHPAFRPIPSLRVWWLSHGPRPQITHGIAFTAATRFLLP